MGREDNERQNVDAADVEFDFDDGSFDEYMAFATKKKSADGNNNNNNNDGRVGDEEFLDLVSLSPRTDNHLNDF